MTTRALILSGEGRYADPWHPFAETSQTISDILQEEGAEVRISGRVEDELASLDGVDLLVVNIGNPAALGHDPAVPEAARRGFVDYVRSGGPLWSFHVSATSFPAMPEWEEAIGGRWVPGVTMHPEIGDAHVRVATDRHPLVAGVEDFVVYDERYSFLRVSSDAQELAFHTYEGREHPLLWAHERGGSRAVYDALGHLPVSYESPQRRRIIRQSYAWLTSES